MGRDIDNPRAPAQKPSGRGDAGSATVTAKGKATRERLLAAARTLFATRGYAETTMRDVAAEAGCATGLAYRYFKGREDLAYALYEGLAADFDRACAVLPDGSVARRFRHVMALRFEQLGAHRPMLRALLPSSVDATRGVGPLSSSTSAVRDRVAAVFVRVVEEADGAPDDDDDVARIARLLYLVHLAVLFAWLVDASPGQRGAAAALDLAVDVLTLAAPLLATPVAGMMVQRVTGIVELMQNKGRPDGQPER